MFGSTAFSLIGALFHRFELVFPHLKLLLLVLVLDVAASYNCESVAAK